MAEIFKLDPEWNVYARCDICHAVHFACCRIHLADEIEEHTLIKHAAQ